MAKRRRGGGAYRNGSYRFTNRRQQALKRAQLASAKKRRGSGSKRIAATAGILGGVAGIAYLGHRNRAAIGRQASSWKKAVQPGAKENTRAGNAISAGHPSRTTTVIGVGERARAQTTRNALARAQLPPHMGGPDRRAYDSNNNVDTAKMTDRGVIGTLITSEGVNPKDLTDKGVARRVRKGKRRIRANAAVTGKKTASLKGTPGGTKTTPKAIRKPGAGPSGLTDAEWGAALAFDSPPSTPVAPAKIPRSVAGKSTPAKTPPKALKQGGGRDFSPGGDFHGLIGKDVTFHASHGQSRVRTEYPAKVVGQGKDQKHWLLDITRASGKTERRHIPVNRISRHGIFLEDWAF